MLVKYNSVSLPDIPHDISVEEYPYVLIIKNISLKYYTLAFSDHIFYYSESDGKIRSSAGVEKYYRLNYDGITIDDDTQWTFIKTISGGDYWVLDSDRSVIWSLCDIPLNSETSTNIYYAGSQIEYPSRKKYLLRDGSTIYTVEDGALAEVAGDLNASMFILFGVDEIPDGVLLLTLNAPEVLCWTDGEKLPVLTATLQGTPEGSHDIVSDNINIGHSSIYGITSVEATASDGAKFLLSFDGGAWMKYNDGTWSASDVGMTAAELMAIPSNAWSSVINSAQYMQLKATLEGVETVTQVVFNYNNESPTS